MATKREQLEKLVRQMEEFGDELDKRDAIGADDITKLNQMGADIKALAESIKAEADASGTLGDAKAFLASLTGDAGTPAESVKGAPAMVDGIVNPNGGTLGDAVAKSPAYEELTKRFVGADGRLNKGFGRVPLFDGKSFGEFTQKTLVTGVAATQGGAYTQNQILPGTVDLIGERQLTVRDLCTNIQINTDTFEYVTITAKTNAAATVPEATTSATPGLNNVAVGAYTAAHGVKPESGFALAVVTSPVETIAHLMPITRRAAADAPQVRSLVDAFLLYGLKEEEEDQILNGNGTSPNLRGILQTVGINTVGSAGTDLDAIVDGIAAIRADRQNPNGIVVHPNDWYSTGFLTAKDTAGNYLLANPGASIDQLNTLWGLRVVVSEAMTENTVLVGNFRQAVVADRMQSTIFVTDSHNDWFARNILAVLAEERLGFGVLDPEAFCTVTAV
jgi:HK97 family phage major capsid protein